MIIKSIVFSFLFLLAGQCMAQAFLVVDTYRGKQRTEYHVGEEIVFRLKNDKELYSGIIQSMKKDVIFISNVGVNLNDISDVLINRKPEAQPKINSALNATFKAAWIIPTIAMLNPVIIKGSDPINAQNVTLSALALASPFYVLSRKNKKAKINKRYRIRILSYDDLGVLPSSAYDID